MQLEYKIKNPYNKGIEKKVDREMILHILDLEFNAQRGYKFLLENKDHFVIDGVVFLNVVEFAYHMNVSNRTAHSYIKAMEKNNIISKTGEISTYYINPEYFNT